MLCKVINTKSVFGNKADVQKLVLEDQKEPQFLYRICGEITGYVTGQSRFTRTNEETGEVTNSEWTKFAGDFIAINRDGRQFESVICFLPDYIGGPLKEAIKNEPGNAVQIGFDVFAMYSEKSATSYEFIAQPMRGGDEKSKAEQMLAAMPALPNAPKNKALAHKK
jgi:hypothetical protein